MTIIKPENKRKGYKLIGVMAEPYIHEYLTLYALARDITKSKLYKKMVDAWVATKRAELTDELLLKELVEKINTQRKSDKQKNIETPENVLSSKEFKEELQEELLNKGLKPTYVKLIISSITL